MGILRQVMRRNAITKSPYAAAILALIAHSTPVRAADLPHAPSPLAPAWSWAGFYVGGHVGALAGTTTFSDPYGPSLLGDSVTSPGFMAGAQLGYNWVVAPRWVLGVGADASYIDSSGTNTCMQATVTLIGSNCKAAPRALATLTGRVGYVIGSEGRTLIYGKGGAAWTSNHVSVNPGNAFLSSQAIFTGDPRLQGDPTVEHANAWGWTAGVGIEQALTPAWSLTAEYAYHRFGHASIATPDTINVTAAGDVTTVPGSTSSVGQDFHVFKLGVNYRWAADPRASMANSSAADGAAMPVKARAVPWVPAWELEGGTRYWYSSGKFQNENDTVPNVILSRLPFENLTAHSGELFARVDAPSRLFLKGFVGVGSIVAGRHHDEDWGLDTGSSNPPEPTAYEFTRADVSGRLSYATADLGFDAMRTRDYRIGLFAGYNYYRETMNGFGCAQMVNPASGVCSQPVPANTMSITQAATWQSLRLGVAAETLVWNRFRIGADLAYLPYVRFNGLDSHWLREPPVFFPQHGIGRGVQAELLLSYLVTDNFSIGVGGRYWAMWTTRGCLECDTVLPPPSTFKANTERYGTFLQASYRFNPAR